MTALSSSQGIPPSSSTAHPQSENTGLIKGVAVGCAVGAPIILALVIYIFFRRWQQKKKKRQEEEDKTSRNDDNILGTALVFRENPACYSELHASPSAFENTSERSVSDHDHHHHSSTGLLAAAHELSDTGYYRQRVELPSQDLRQHPRLPPTYVMIQNDMCLDRSPSWQNGSCSIKGEVMR